MNSPSHLRQQTGHAIGMNPPSHPNQTTDGSSHDGEENQPLFE
jgi:hypothetical protein